MIDVRRCAACGVELPDDSAPRFCRGCLDQQGGEDVGGARRRLLGPALGLLAAGAVACVQFLAPQFFPFAELDRAWRQALELLILGPVSGVILLAGGVQMFRLHGLGFVRFACILGMLPCSLGWFVGLPAGLWGLTVLNRPDVAGVFRARAARKAAAYRAAMRRADEEIDADLREPPDSPWADV